MSKNKSSRKISSAAAAAVLAVLLIAVCVVSCIAAGTTSGAVDAASAFAKQQVTDFNNTSIRTDAVYTSEVLRKACVAALLYTGKDEDMETIATTLSLDTIIIADEKGKIVAAYPEALPEASLKETEHAKTLVPVAKGITVKAMGDIVRGEDGSYTVYAGAARTDAGGAIVISMASESYADVSGETLAKSCGENVIIEKDGKRFSSDFDAAKESSISDLGVAEDGKAYTVTVDGKGYQAKAETVENYRVLTAVEAGGSNPQMIIIIACAAALVIGCVVLFAAGKKRDE